MVQIPLKGHCLLLGIHRCDVTFLSASGRNSETLFCWEMMLLQTQSRAKKMCHLKSELSIFWCPNPMSAACCLLESTGVLGRLVYLWHPVSDGASLWVVGNKAVSPQRLPVSSLYAKKKSYRIMSVICLFLAYFYCTVATSFFFVHDIPL